MCPDCAVMILVIWSRWFCCGLYRYGVSWWRYTCVLRMSHSVIIIIITNLPNASLLHSYAVKSLLVTMAHPKFAPKSTPSRGPIPKPHYTCLIPGPVRPMMRNGIRIRSAVLPQCTGQTDRPTHVRTDRQTDRSSTEKFDDYRPLRYESDVA